MLKRQPTSAAPGPDDRRGRRKFEAPIATRSRGRIRLLRPLGFFGLDHLDAVVLATLADGRPLLLIGAHGTAKSELLNTLAREPGLRHRH